MSDQAAKRTRLILGTWLALGGAGLAAPLEAQEIRPYTKPNNPGPERFAKRIVVDGLSAPTEVTYGPDGKLWVNERAAKRIVRVDPVDGSRKVALTLDEAYSGSSQDGLLGFALHPDLLRGHGHSKDYVYLAFTYGSGAADAIVRTLKLRRYTYDEQSETLTVA